MFIISNSLHAATDHLRRNIVRSISFSGTGNYIAASAEAPVMIVVSEA
jgi:hypothetical protein